MKHMKGYRCATKGTMGLREALLEAFKERLSKTESLDKTLSYLNRYFFNGQEVSELSGAEVNEWFQDVIEQMNAQRRLDGKRAYRKDTSIALGFVGYPDADFTKTLSESEKASLSQDVHDAFSLWLGHDCEAEADHTDEGFGVDEETGEIKQFGGWHKHLFGIPLDENGNLEPRKLTNKKRMRELHKVVIDYLNQKTPGLNGQYASRNWDFEAHLEGGNPDKTQGLSANQRAKVLEYINNAKARADALDARSAALDDREGALDERESALDKREQNIETNKKTYEDKLHNRAHSLNEKARDLQTKIDALDTRAVALDDREIELDARDIRLTNSLKKSQQKEKECDDFYSEVKSQIGVDIRSENWQQSLENIIQTLRRKALEESEEVVGNLLGTLRNFHEYTTFILGFKNTYTKDESDIFKEAQTVTQQMREFEISYGLASPDDDSKTQQTNAHTTQTENEKRLQSYLDAIEENRNENQGEYDSPSL